MCFCFPFKVDEQQSGTSQKESKTDATTEGWEYDLKLSYLTTIGIASWKQNLQNKYLNNLKYLNKVKLSVSKII